MYYKNHTTPFSVGEVFPPQEHYERVLRCKDNKKIFKGYQLETFYKNTNRVHRYEDTLYISANLGGIIAKKSADFLFGEPIKVLAGLGDNTPEQKALDRFVETNHLNILLYESALSNAYSGDSFIRVRYGQEYGGEMPHELDPFRVIIEPIDSSYVFPQCSPVDRNKIVAFHVAIPYFDEEENQWFLNVETHTAGQINYHQYTVSPLYHDINGEVERFNIDGVVEESFQVVKTGVPVPLIVHIPNLSTSESWEGQDDLTELHPLLSEINNRLTQIASVLDKHADPALAVPSGVMAEGPNGEAQFRVATDKVFEILGKEDIIPQYITFQSGLNEAFMELDKLISLVLTLAELPEVALGRGDSGTSGSSGLAIKWRMNSLLAKVNRKRQYYAKGLKQIFYIAQKLEEVLGIADYELTIPVLEFNDGLPKDEMEQANIASIRTNGAKTMSQKTAIMKLNDMTEEQAEAEIERIKKEEEAQLGATDATFLNPSLDEDDPILAEEPFEEEVGV